MLSGIRTSNAQDRAVCELARDRVLDLPIRLIIDRRSRLVEDEDLAVLDECTRKAEQATLAHTEVRALALDHGFQVIA